MSTLKTRTVQLGDSATAANNFLISVPAVPDGTLTIKRGNGDDVLSIDANGRIRQPSSLIVCSARTPENTVNGELTVHHFVNFNVDSLDVGGFLNTSTGRYQPNVAGYYLVNITVEYTMAGIAPASAVCAIVTKNGEVNKLFAVSNNDAAGFLSLPGSTVLFLNGTTDYAGVATAQSSGSDATDVVGTFEAFLLHAV